jgi:phage major head subunit gpT-like protein
MAISEQWAQLLEPGLRSIFNITFGELAAASRIPMLFNVMNSAKSSEYFLGVGGMSDWNAYKGTIEYDDPEQGYKTTLTHEEYSKGFKVERKLVDDDLYNVINQRPRGLALSAARTREKHAASVFNNAFSTSYAGGDSQPLCESAGHPYSPSNASTQTNEGSYALTYDNIVTVRRLMREFKDDRGELIPINPDTLLVPPELEATGYEALNTFNAGSTQQADLTDYAARLVGAGAPHSVNLIVWDYLTDANAWFMIDSRLAKEHLLWLDRTQMEFALDPTSNFRLEARYRGYMRYSYGWSDWRWVYGNNPS